MNYFIFILALCVQLNKSIKVLTTPKFPKDKAPAASFATLKNPTSPVLTTLSSCLWTSLYAEDFGSTWSFGNNFFRTSFRSEGKIFAIGEYTVILIDYPEHLLFTPEKWLFFCFSFDNIEKVIKVYVDSEKILEKKIHKGLEDFEIESNFLKEEKFANAKEFAGQISDLNIWSKILIEKEIFDLYSCKAISINPDVVNWTNTEFELGPNITITERKEHPCLEKENEKSQHVIYNFTTSMELQRSPIRFCEGLGGRMEYPQNEFELSSLGKSLTKVQDECYGKWMPIFKDNSENLVDVDENMINFTFWQRGQPNGAMKETCIVGKIEGSRGFSSYDANCANEVCFYCKIKDFLHFQLKGLCQMKDSQVIDRQYVLRPRNLIDGRPIWKGYSSSLIYWDGSLERWVLSNRISKKILATLKSKTPFPLGEQKWELQSEKICDENSLNENQILMLSKCKKFEYSCSDGSCIPIELKCNFVPDCWDGDDEKKCPILRVSNLEGYKSYLPDVTVDEAGDIIKKPVKVAIDITNVESIQEVKSRFTSAFTLTAEWTDTRLVWNDLNEDVFLNIPSEEQKNIFWFPKIILVNSENNFEIPNDEEAKLLVKRNGTFTMSNEYDLQETAYFAGEDNPVFYSRDFNVKFKCNFDLRFFPFDTQTCSISLTAGNKVRNFIELVGESLEFTGKTKLATFDVVKWNLETLAISSEIDVKVNIFLKRQIAQHFLGIYLPSVFIMTIAQVGF